MSPTVILLKISLIRSIAMLSKLKSGKEKKDQDALLKKRKEKKDLDARNSKLPKLDGFFSFDFFLLFFDWPYSLRE